ncbi:MAG TPA: hypothetical protein VF006_02210 [Longimicrobium sp.]
MRPSLVSLGLATWVAACGPAASAPPSDVPSLEPRSARSVRIYSGTTPRCGFRDLGTVTGRTLRDLQTRAFQMHANAVILENAGYGDTGYTRAMAIVFTRADCQE